MEILTAVSYILKDTTAVISILMIMRYIFLNKLQLKKPIIALLTAGVLSNALIGVFVLMRAEPTSDEMMDFISNVIYIVTAKLLTNEKKLGKIIWIIMLYIMSVDMLFSLISPYISEQLYAECIVNTLMFTAVCVLIHLLAEKTRFNLLPKVFDEIPRWVLLQLCFLTLPVTIRNSASLLPGMRRFILFRAFWL